MYKKKLNYIQYKVSNGKTNNIMINIDSTQVHKL